MSVYLGSFCGSRVVFLSVAMEGLPVHPSMVGHQSAGVATPPQDRGERHTTHENILKFFDKNTYRRGVVPKTSCNVHGQNTKETMHNTHREGGQTCQKRSATSEASGSQSSRSAKLPKTMTQEELVEKFKLAASLNGLSWEELAVTRTLLNKLNNVFHISRGKPHQCRKHTTMINQSSSRLPAKAEIATTAPSSGASIACSSHPAVEEHDGQELSDEELAALEAEVEAELDKMVAMVADEQPHPSMVPPAEQAQGQQLQAGQVQPVVPQVQGQQLQAGQVQGQQLQAGQVQPVVPQAGQVQGQQLQAGQVQPVVPQAETMPAPSAMTSTVPVTSPSLPSIVPTPHTMFFGRDGLPVKGPSSTAPVPGEGGQAGQVQVAQAGQAQGRQLQAGQVQHAAQVQPVVAQVGQHGQQLQAGQVQAGQDQQVVARVGQHGQQLQAGQVQAGQDQQVVAQVGQHGQQLQAGQVQAGQDQQVVAQVGQHGQQLQAGQVQAGQDQQVVAQVGQGQGQQVQAGQVQQAAQDQSVVAQAGQVQRQQLQAGQVQAGQVQEVVAQAGQAQGQQLQAGQVRGQQLQAGQVQGQQLQAGQIQAGQVQGQLLQAGQVQGQQLQAGQVQAGQVQGQQLQAGQVQGQQLQAGQVQGQQLQAGQVQQVVAQAGQDGQQLQAGQVQPVVDQAGQNQGPASLPALVDQAVATAADEAEKKRQLEAAGLATSSSHRSEYMAFLRAAKHPYPGLEWLNVASSISNLDLFTHIPSLIYGWWIQSCTYYRSMAPN